VLSNKDAVILTNSLAAIDNGYVTYTTNANEDFNFQIIVNQKDSEGQVIQINNTYGNEKRQYFLGNPPYIVNGKEFPTASLSGSEYYRLYYKVNLNYGVCRLFGNNLPLISDGFEFGALENNWLYVQLLKQDIGQHIDIVNTNIKFINKTDVFIQYRTEASMGHWADKYRAEDTLTDHYKLSISGGDYLYFWYKADLRKSDQPIECKIYDADNDVLLMTAYLNAQQDNQDVWGGSQNGARNIRIECDYAPMN